MEDTRAVAHLPNLEIEIRHRKAPEEGAEFLSVTLKAMPDLETAALWFDPLRLMQAWASFNPWLAGWPMLGGWQRHLPSRGRD